MNNLSIAPDRGEINREFSQKEINEIVEGLINNSIQIENVPSCVHSRLFTPLSLARNEAKLGNVKDKYNHLNNIIWSLKLTLVQPDKSLMPQIGQPSTLNLTETRSFSQRNQYNINMEPQVSLVSAMKNEEDLSDAAATLRLKGNIDTTRKYYEKEEEHINDLRDKEYKELCKTHKMQQVPDDVNEAKRAEDEFELQLVASRNKWNEKMKKLRENKEKEISEMEAELSYYDKAQKTYDDSQYSLYQDYYSNTVQMPSTDSPQTQKKSKSSKKMAQTLQPKQSPKQTNKLKQTSKL